MRLLMSIWPKPASLGSGRTRWRREARFPLASSAILALALAACGAGVTSPSGQPSVAPDKITLGNPGGSSAASLPWIAQAGGYFAKHGLDATIQVVTAHVQTEALISDQMQIGYASVGDVATAVAHGADLVMIGASFQRPIWSIVGVSSIDGVKGLRGAIVGVNSLGSTGDLLVRELAQSAGYIVGKDVSVVALQNPPALLAALDNGQIQAAALSEPGTSMATARGFKVIYDQAKEGASTLGNPLTIRRAYLASHRDVAKRFLMANMDAVHLMKTQPEVAAPYTAKFLKIDDPQVLLNGMKSIAAISDERLSMPAEDVQEKIRIASATTPELKNMDARQLLDGSLLDELAKDAYVPDSKR